MPTPKIFVFVNGSSGMGYHGCAIAEDGTALAGHCSSNLMWLYHDMGLRPHNGDNWQHDKYAAHYPDGYDLVDVIGEPGTVEAHPEAMAAIALANAKDAAEAREGQS
jgi:hypothetical protein